LGTALLIAVAVAALYRQGLYIPVADLPSDLKDFPHLPRLNHLSLGARRSDGARSFLCLCSDVLSRPFVGDGV